MSSSSFPQQEQDLSTIYQEQEELRAQIEGFKHLIEEAPLIRQAQIENERTTMPAPDGLDEIARQRMFLQDLSKNGKVENRPLYTANNLVLIIISIITMIAVVWWVSTEIMKSGILAG